MTDPETGSYVDRPTHGSVEIDVGLARCRLRGYRRNGAAFFRAELSAPTMLYGQNRLLLSRDLLADAVDALLADLARTFPDVPAVGQVTLCRLDLTRDFADLDSVAFTLENLASRPVAYARKHTTDRRTDGSIQTFTTGSTSQWLVRGYDKGAELRSPSSPYSSRRENRSAWGSITSNVLRFEAQFRARLLRQKGIHVVTQIQEQQLDALAREYFLRAGWDAPYGGPAPAQEKLEAIADSLSSADLRNLIVWIYCAEKGIKDPPLSRHAVETVRPIARRHHLIGNRSSRTSRRLDFDRGVEVSET